MIIIGPDSRAERLEVMLWTAGTGRQTPAVQRYVMRYQLTFAAALILRQMSCPDQE